MSDSEKGGTQGGGGRAGTSKVIFQRQMDAKIRDLIFKLRENYPFFSEMHEREIEEFLRLCKNETFQEGETIFEKGEVGDKFYLIVSGAVLILPGKSEIRLGPGNMFGEMAILDQDTRTAAAKAVSETTLFSIDRKILSTQMVTLRSKIAIGIAKQLSEKLRNANEIMHQISDQLSVALTKISEL